MRSECESCGADFQVQDKQYVVEEISRKVGETTTITVCFLCAVVNLKETIQLLGDNVWTRPFSEIYRLLFPDTISSWYVQPLMKALTELYLEHWADRPTETPKLFI